MGTSLNANLDDIYACLSDEVQKLLAFSLHQHQNILRSRDTEPTAEQAKTNQQCML